MSVAFGMEFARARSVAARVRYIQNGGSAKNEAALAANIAAQAAADFAMIGWDEEASGATTIARRFHQRADKLAGVRRNKWRRK